MSKEQAEKVVEKFRINKYWIYKIISLTPFLIDASSSTLNVDYKNWVDILHICDPIDVLVKGTVESHLISWGWVEHETCIVCKMIMPNPKKLAIIKNRRMVTL